MNGLWRTGFRIARFSGHLGSILLAVGLCLSLGGISGCSSGGRADLVVINGPEPESLDPAVLTGQPDGRIAMELFEGLTRYDPRTAKPIPGLAERWDISADLRTYVFHLRTNAVWSTGERITSEDFLYAWLRLLDPATRSDYAGLLFYVHGAEDFFKGRAKDASNVGLRAPTPSRFEVELVDPTPFFLDLCAYVTLRVVPRQAIEAHGDRWLMQRPLPVSGPYQLEEWRLNHRVRLRKNPRYWDAAQTRLEVIDLLPVSTPATALNLYETGQADIIWDKEWIPLELIDELEQRPDFHRYTYLGTYFLRFNVTRSPFDDPRVRKALALAIDKARIVTRITRAGELPASHYVPPGVDQYQSPEGLPYDPDEARRLLAEAGYEGGQGFRRFEYLFNNVKTHEKIAVELQGMWRRELGIEMDLRQQEWKVFLRGQSDLNYDVCRSSWLGDYNDASTFLDVFMSDNGNNRTGWKHPEYDRLLREAAATADARARAAVLERAERILVLDEMPLAPIYFYVGVEYYDKARWGGIHQNVLARHPLSAIRRLRTVEADR